MNQYERFMKVLVGVLVTLFILLMVSGVFVPESLWRDESGAHHAYKDFIADVAGWMVAAQLIWFFSALSVILRNPRIGAMLLISYFIVFSIIDALNGPFVTTPPVSFLDDMTSFISGALAALAFIVGNKRSPDRA